MSESPEAKERNAHFLREMEAAEAVFTPLPLTLNLTESLMLVAHLKIALSHPQNRGPEALWANMLLRALQGAVSVTPLMTEIAHKGWTGKVWGGE
jgi:hypothetical protein